MVQNGQLFIVSLESTLLDSFSDSLLCTGLKRWIYLRGVDLALGSLPDWRCHSNKIFIGL